MTFGLPDLIFDLFVNAEFIDIESLKNRLLKVCYVPTTSAGLKGKLLFFSFFVAAAIDSTNEANKAPYSSLYSWMSMAKFYRQTQLLQSKHQAKSLGINHRHDINRVLML